MDDTDQLLALIHSVGFKVGASEHGTRLDCPFCEDRMDLCRAWLAGFSIGRLTRSRNDVGDDTSATAASGQQSGS